MNARQRTIAACNASVIEQMRRECRLSRMANRSISDLHYDLGKALESKPGEVVCFNRSMDSNKRHWEGLQVESMVRPVLVQVSAKQKAEADRQWSEIPNSRDAIREWMKGDAQ
tara:strand:- start:84 stop:422 length:339 start_codon:yes stop_codon:yes gene_type:complete